MRFTEVAGITLSEFELTKFMGAGTFVGVGETLFSVAVGTACKYEDEKVLYYNAVHSFVYLMIHQKFLCLTPFCSLSVPFTFTMFSVCQWHFYLYSIC